MPSQTPRTRKGRVHNARLEIRRDPLRGFGVRAVAFVTFPGSETVQRIKTGGFWSSESVNDDVRKADTSKELADWLGLVSKGEVFRLQKELACCGFSQTQMRLACKNVPIVEL